MIVSPYTSVTTWELWRLLVDDPRLVGGCWLIAPATMAPAQMAVDYADSDGGGSAGSAGGGLQ